MNAFHDDTPDGKYLSTVRREGGGVSSETMIIASVERRTRGTTGRRPRKKTTPPGVRVRRGSPGMEPRGRVGIL